MPINPASDALEPDPSGRPGAVKESHLGQAAESVNRHIEAINRRAGRNLFASLGVAVGLIAVVAAGLWWWKWGFVLLVGLALLGGVRELAQALRAQLGARPTLPPLLVGGLALLIGVYSASGGWSGWSQTALLRSWSWGEVLLGGLTLTALACLVWRLPGGVEGYVRDVAASLFILAYLPLLGSSIMVLLAAPDGPRRIALFIVAVVGCDTGAYVTGVLLGRHKMAPRISPGKTWEGLIGGLIWAAAFGLAMAWLCQSDWWRTLLVAVAVAVSAVLGDLIESAVKRDLGLKDLGHLLPGHGGIMDRIDSYVVAAPVAWLTMTLLLPGS
ncbi:MAG: phosphatidate cytidylyltransferase [Propionibacteriaceae bacterium]|jgi:phosphatidate cytidylyltransferase|nr:phosphatidate cytidylyltransferase [Propionibacteriaceae bacterium]